MLALSLPCRTLWAIPVLLFVLVSGCSLKPAQKPTIDELIPAGATKAEIPPAFGTNHSEPQGEIAWKQGIKFDGDLNALLAELEVKLEPRGYRLENHEHYRDTFGKTSVSNAEVLRIFRGRGSSIAVFDFTVLPPQGEEYARFAIMLRLR